jgi:hypothetical protein
MQRCNAYYRGITEGQQIVRSDEDEKLKELYEGRCCKHCGQIFMPSYQHPNAQCCLGCRQRKLSNFQRRAHVKQAVSKAEPEYTCIPKQLGYFDEKEERERMQREMY